MKTMRTRSNYNQSICDLRTRANVQGLTDAEALIAQAIYTDIPQYRAAAKVLAQGEIYRRIAPQVGGYGDLSANCGAAYIWENNSLVCIAHNTPVYRLYRMMEAYHDYVSGIVNADVWNNYSHGGYLTRRGLYLSQSDDKMKRVAESHMLITDTGKAGHDSRVAIR